MYVRSWIFTTHIFRAGKGLLIEQTLRSIHQYLYLIFHIYARELCPAQLCVCVQNPSLLVVSQPGMAILVSGYSIVPSYSGTVSQVPGHASVQQYLRHTPGKSTALHHAEWGRYGITACYKSTQCYRIASPESDSRLQYAIITAEWFDERRTTGGTHHLWDFTRSDWPALELTRMPYLMRVLICNSNNIPLLTGLSLCCTRCFSMIQIFLESCDPGGKTGLPYSLKL